MKITLLLVAALFFFACPVLAGTVVLSYTLPSHEAYTAYAGTDSAEVTCEESSIPTADLATVRLYGWPLTGGSGGFRFIREKDVRGREGEPDTLRVESNASYFVTAVDESMNESCPSPIVHVFDLVTGVDPTGVIDHVVSVELYTVMGAAVSRMGASGVYYERTRYASGKIHVREIILVK